MIAARCLICTIVLGMWGHGSDASAQSSREEAIIELQRQKAATLKPYEPNKVEQLLLQMQDTLILQPNGFYPTFGSVYSGGGFTLGAGYRRYLGDRVNWNLTGLYSAKSYKLIQLGLHSPRPLTGRVDFNAVIGWRDATQVGFHGLGIDSPEARSAFRMQQGFVGGDLSFRPRHWTVWRAGLGYESFTLADGTGGEPGVSETFTPLTAPGLGDSPDYLHSFVSAAVDTRPSPEYARHGGLYEIAYHQFTDREDTYSFNRVDAEIVQHLPVLRESWVVSLRGRLQTTLDDDDVVPYFLLPSLGSGSTLRGFASWRFRDRHGLLLSAEWRWMVNRMAMDAALFYDVGTVAPRLDALTLGDMQSDIGIGVRFHSPVVTPLRIELARSREGFKLVFSSHAAF